MTDVELTTRALFHELPRFRRIHNPDMLDQAEIDGAVTDGITTIVQFAGEWPSDAVAAALDALCARHGTRIGLCIATIYYGDPADAVWSRETAASIVCPADEVPASSP